MKPLQKLDVLLFFSIFRAMSWTEGSEVSMNLSAVLTALCTNFIRLQCECMEEDYHKEKDPVVIHHRFLRSLFNLLSSPVFVSFEHMGSQLFKFKRHSWKHLQAVYLLNWWRNNEEITHICPWSSFTVNFEPLKNRETEHKNGPIRMCIPSN